MATDSNSQAQTAPTARIAVARRANWKSLLILTIICLGGAFAIRWNAIRSSLTLQATRVPHIDRSRLTGLADYEWLSPHELLAFDYRRHGLQVRSEIVRIDARTGTFTPCATLNARLGTRLHHKIWYSRVSPDGRTLLFVYHTAREVRCVTAAIDDDGSPVRDWLLDSDTNTQPMLAWLPDSRHCGYAPYDIVAHKATLKIYACDDPAHPAQTDLQLPAFTAPGVLLGFDAQGRAISTLCALPTTPPTALFAGNTVNPKMSAPAKSTALIAATSHLLQYPPLDGNVLVLGGGQGAVAQHHLKLPPYTSLSSMALPSLSSMALSPQGDRIALILSIVNPPVNYPWLRFLSGHFPPPEGTTTWRIWECRTDGEDMHPISAEVVGMRGNPVALTEARWLPDGRRISFLYNEALYTLSAD